MEYQQSEEKMADAPEPGNEIVPLNSESQIALPSNENGSLAAPTQSEGDEIVPLNSENHVALPSNENGSLAAPTQSEESRSMPNASGARPKQSQKPACEEDVVQISEDLFMYSKEPLRERTIVYKGYQLLASGRRRPVAIKKIIPCEYKHLAELEHLLTLSSHPHVLQIIQSEGEPGLVRVLYIVMELYSSRNLEDYIRKTTGKYNPFNFDQTMSLTKQLISGIRYIHHNRIAHRDLKPENILVSDDGEHIKVSVFGMSKQFPQIRPVILCYFGDPDPDHFRAPETFKSESIFLSVDIYSLGRVMYSIWSNVGYPFYPYPFKGVRSFAELPISETKKNQLRQLIDWMLQPDPKQRPTIEQVAQHTFFNSEPGSMAEGAVSGKKSKAIQGFKPVNKSWTKKHPLVSQPAKWLKKLFQSTPDVGKVTMQDYGGEVASRDTVIHRDTHKNAKVASCNDANAIAVFDKNSKAIQAFKPSDQTWTRLHAVTDEIIKKKFTAVTLNDEIIVLACDKLHKTNYKLKYTDLESKWVRLPDRSYSGIVVAVALHGEIYAFYDEYDHYNQYDDEYWPNEAYLTIEKLGIHQTSWSQLMKLFSCRRAAVISVGDFIYTFGGFHPFIPFHNIGRSISKAAKFDPNTST